MSLKTELHQMIKDRNGGILTLDEITDFCKKARYKVSNAEKRLRDLRAKYLKGQPNPDYDPNIQPVWNEKRTAIVGYRYYIPDPQGDKIRAKILNNGFTLTNNYQAIEEEVFSRMLKR